MVHTVLTVFLYSAIDPVLVLRNPSVKSIGGPLLMGDSLNEYPRHHKPASHHHPEPCPWVNADLPLRELRAQRLGREELLTAAAAAAAPHMVH